MNELRKVPSLKLVSLNTDSIQFEIDEDKVSLAEEVLNQNIKAGVEDDSGRG